MANLNWGELMKEAGDAGSFEPLPDGDYDLTIIEATATTSGSGKPMFKVTAEINGGPHNKRRIWDNLVISHGNSNALAIFFNKMKALGLTKAFFDQGPSMAQIESAMIGRQFRGKIGHHTYQGELKNDIKGYYPAATAATPAPAAAAAPAPAPAPAPAAAPAPAPAPAPAAAPQQEFADATASAAPPAPF